MCRELQKHNKLIKVLVAKLLNKKLIQFFSKVYFNKDENLIRVKEEEEKRKEISAKFQVRIFYKEIQKAKKVLKLNFSLLLMI